MVAAAAAKLPCILDIDGPNVPNWAWAGYLAPIEGMDDILSKYLPHGWKVQGQDVFLRLLRRGADDCQPRSVLKKYGIRVPTVDQPWTKDEFMAGLKKIKDSGDFDYRWTSQPVSPVSGGPTRTRHSCRALVAT